MIKNFIKTLAQTYYYGGEDEEEDYVYSRTNDNPNDSFIDMESGNLDEEDTLSPEDVCKLVKDKMLTNHPDTIEIDRGFFFFDMIREQIQDDLSRNTIISYLLSKDHIYLQLILQNVKEFEVKPILFTITAAGSKEPDYYSVRGECIESCVDYFIELFKKFSLVDNEDEYSSFDKNSNDNSLEKSKDKRDYKNDSEEEEEYEDFDPSSLYNKIHSSSPYTFDKRKKSNNIHNDNSNGITYNNYRELGNGIVEISQIVQDKQIEKKDGFNIKTPKTGGSQTQRKDETHKNK